VDRKVRAVIAFKSPSIFFPARSASVTQHLNALEAANLVTTVWRGREKLHYLNPVPLQQIYERWIRKFETPRLSALHKLKKRFEGL
jgi:hypothetical protein